jgi:hypothetical protein
MIASLSSNLSTCLSYTKARVWPGTSLTVALPKSGSKGDYKTYALNVVAANNAGYAQYIVGTQNTTEPYLQKAWGYGVNESLQNPISNVAYDSSGKSIVITFSTNSYWYVNMVEFTTI